MITHFAELQLYTVSTQSVRQFYYDQLHFPIVYESDAEIRFQPTEHVKLSFIATYEPIAPAHFAFEVPYSEFECVTTALKENNINIQKWPDGREVNSFETGKNVYFRDNDGNLLEFISHSYVQEDVLPTWGPFKILYLREVGFPVESVLHFREWLNQVLGMKMDKTSDDFTFAISGTAHAVISSKQRKWIPISMMALAPKMNVTLGVSSILFIEKIHSILRENSPHWEENRELVLKENGYSLRLSLSSFDPEIPSLLNLPLSKVW